MSHKKKESRIQKQIHKALEKTKDPKHIPPTIDLGEGAHVTKVIDTPLPTNLRQLHLLCEHIEEKFLDATDAEWDARKGSKERKHAKKRLRKIVEKAVEVDEVFEKELQKLTTDDLSKYSMLFVLPDWTVVGVVSLENDEFLTTSKPIDKTFSLPQYKRW